MSNWIELKRPPLVGDVIRWREEVRGPSGRKGRALGWRTLEAEVIAIKVSGTRHDDLTLKVLAQEGAEGAIKLVGRWILRRGVDVYRPDSEQKKGPAT